MKIPMKQMEERSGFTFKYKVSERHYLGLGLILIEIRWHRWHVKLIMVTDIKHNKTNSLLTASSIYNTIGCGMQTSLDGTIERSYTK